MISIGGGAYTARASLQGRYDVVVVRAPCYYEKTRSAPSAVATVSVGTIYCNQDIEETQTLTRTSQLIFVQQRTKPKRQAVFLFKHLVGIFPYPPFTLRSPPRIISRKLAGKNPSQGVRLFSLLYTGNKSRYTWYISRQSSLPKQHSVPTCQESNHEN